MMEVEARFLERGDCGGDFERCSLTDEGCPRFGLLLKAARDGRRRVKGCGDPVARGKRNKAKGRIKQAAAVRALGIPRSNLHPGHEEFLPGAVRTEVKAGGKAKTVDTAYRLVRVQSDASKAVADVRPFVPVFMPDGSKHGYVVIRTDELVNAVEALHSQLCGEV